MALVRNIAIGPGRKSAGDATYRIVRGRTIMSRRITENKSKTAMQVTQRSHFANVSAYAASVASYVDLCWDKSTYGSRRNNAVKNNYNNFLIAANSGSPDLAYIRQTFTSAFDPEVKKEKGAAQPYFAKGSIRKVQTSLFLSSESSSVYAVQLLSAPQVKDGSTITLIGCNAISTSSDTLTMKSITLDVVLFASKDDAKDYIQTGGGLQQMLQGNEVPVYYDELGYLNALLCDYSNATRSLNDFYTALGINDFTMINEEPCSGYSVTRSNVVWYSFLTLRIGDKICTCDTGIAATI